MNIRTRAIDAQEKGRRRQTILDAAEGLLLAYPDRVASVDEVAAAAGLAKGTVYLYFPSKEELLLALHERHVEGFFNALLALLAREREVTVEDTIAITRSHMVDIHGFLPLAGLCFGLMEKSIPLDAAIAFKLRIADWLQRAGAGVERHFPALNPGDGATLLMHSYALIVGLWQMLHPSPIQAEISKRPELAMLNRKYAVELDNALRALWAGRQSTPQQVTAEPQLASAAHS
jgi:AcrR family transcriptional regulator